MTTQTAQSPLTNRPASRNGRIATAHNPYAATTAKATRSESKPANGSYQTALNQIRSSLAVTRGWAIFLAVAGILLGLVCLLPAFQALVAAVQYSSKIALVLLGAYLFTAIAYFTLAYMAGNLAAKFGPAIGRPTAENMAVATRANMICWITTGIFAAITLLAVVALFVLTFLVK